jgi:hypothetical protein
MITQFTTVDVDLAQAAPDLQSAIEDQLRTQGEPLRWAITAVHRGMAHVEAVVIQGADIP